MYNLKSMNRVRAIRLFLFALALCCFSTLPIESAELVTDRAITLHSTKQVTEKRRALLRYIWGSEGFPERRLPDKVLTNVPSPVKGLTQVARVDELRMDLAPGLQ